MLGQECRVSKRKLWTLLSLWPSRAYGGSKIAGSVSSHRPRGGATEGFLMECGAMCFYARLWAGYPARWSSTTFPGLLLPPEMLPRVLFGSIVFFFLFWLLFLLCFFFYMQGHKCLPCILAHTENYFNIHMLLKMHILFETMYIYYQRL